MSRLREEVMVIPRTGRFLSVAFAAVCSFFFVVVTEEEELVVRIAVAILVPAVILVYLLLVCYVYGDSTRRGMRPIMWTLVALLVPNAIGIIAYFIVRDPVLHPCPSCGTAARREYAFCPSCGITLVRSCPSCVRPVEPIWTHCAHCGGKLPAGEIEIKPPEPFPPDIPDIDDPDPEADSAKNA